MGNSVDLVKARGAEALYINEKLVLELDEISGTDIIPLMLHNSFDTFGTYRASEVWLERIDWNFPENLREVVEENGKTIAENWEQS